MLTRGRWLASLLILLAGHANAAAISGAFGVEFGTPVPGARLGSVAPAHPPPPPFEWVVPGEAPTGLQPTWFFVAPTAVPVVFDDVDGQFAVQLDHDDIPLRIIATFADACIDMSATLISILARKYPRLRHMDESNDAGAWFGSDHIRAGIYCHQSALVVDYVDIERYRRWETATRDRLAVLAEETRAAEAAQALLAQEAEDELRRLAEEDAQRKAAALVAAAQRQRNDEESAAKQARSALVDALLSESARRIESVFGVPFKQPFTEVSGFTPDVPLPITRSAMVAPFDDGTFTLELDPESNPIAVRGTFRVDAPESVAESLALALRERFGAPRKDVPRHRIFEISGDYLIVKRSEEETIEVIAINESALQIQRRRKREATAALEADRARRFEQETQGL